MRPVSCLAFRCSSGPRTRCFFSFTRDAPSSGLIPDPRTYAQLLVNSAPNSTIIEA